MEVIYKIDGIDMSTYGVYVSASEGLLSRPKPKKPLSVQWQDYNGEVVDLSKRTYEPREIELECFIKADSQWEFQDKCKTFLDVFDLVDTKRLSVSVGDAIKPLVYEVYGADAIEIKKTWSEKNMVGTFKLKLTEPEPIKKVIKFIAVTGAMQTSITVTSAKLLNVYWGDCSHTYDVSGIAQTVTHTFSTTGTYYIVVTGNIDEITSLTTNGEIVWSKL